MYRATKEGLKRWLSRARDVVMTPFRQFGAQPNPQSIAATAPLWQEQVVRILESLTPAIREGWMAAHLPGDVDLTDPYIQANLALTRNLLVRIPDEVHAMVVAQILEGNNAGESTAQIARRVDSVLTFTDSENWDNRARVIAITESTRHRNSSLLAHGLLSEKNGRRDLAKQWDTRMDTRERPAHRLANDQVQVLNHPFMVDGEPLLFPGDPVGSADNSCGCRCDLRLIYRTEVNA